MTDDKSTHPGDVCTESRDADSPTAFQEACGLMGVYPHQENTLVANKWFGKGWDAGVERDLGAEFYPTEAHVIPYWPDNVREAQLAFILGLTAGLIAEVKGYDTAYCIYKHNGGADCVNEDDADQTDDNTGTAGDRGDGGTGDYSSADTHRDPYLPGRVTADVQPFLIVDEEVVDNPDYK